MSFQEEWKDEEEKVEKSVTIVADVAKGFEM